MSRPVAVQVEGLGKRFYIGAAQEKYRTFREAVMDALASPFRRAASLVRGHATGAAELHEAIWALRDLSFEVREGEVVGVVGANGAGKTTLLKILSRITEPTEGWAEIRGRVGSLLEVGTGFHPELTGRENVYLNGAILGMGRGEIDRKFDEIVAFAEVEKFLDTPVKHYSSGMYVRLAFAVAAHLEPEILIVDEVLSVGDAAFQRKCLGKMGKVAGEGRTVLFVSHNMAAVTRLCSRAILLQHGRVVMDGGADEVVNAYLASGAEESASWTRPDRLEVEGPVWFREVEVVDEEGETTPFVRYDQPARIRLTYRVEESIRNLSIASAVTDQQGNLLWISEDGDERRTPLERDPGTYRSTCHVPPGILKPGRYLVSCGAHVPRIRNFGGHERVVAFDVSDAGFPPGANRQGVVKPLLEWTTENLDPAPAAAERSERKDLAGRLGQGGNPA